MNWPQRFRNIALSRLRALKDQLDRIDAEVEDDALTRRIEREAAVRELEDPGDTLPRTPAPSLASEPASPAASAPSPAPASSSALAKHYRILGLPDGADLADVEAAYRKLSARCSSVSFDEGSDEQQTVSAIMSRVDAAYEALRDALNPTAGRFDKLEL